MPEYSEELSIRLRKSFLLLFAVPFVVGAVTFFTRGKVVETVFFTVFAVAILLLRWTVGKWWAELDI